MIYSGFVVRDKETLRLREGNHPGSWVVFQSKVAAEKEVEYLNHRAPDAPLCEKYIVSRCELAHEPSY